MLATLRHLVALYVDRTSGQWVVRDPDGAFWLLPAGEGGWEQRTPLVVTERTDLEVVPGHYKYMLNLPF